jgi:membrane-associated phospholipid phosphatase
MAPNASNHWRLGPEIRYAATLILLFLIAQLSDQWIFHHFRFRGIYDGGWGRMLRLAGYLPLWSIVGLALVLHDWVPRALPTLRRASRRGLLLFWSAALGGIIAERLKIAVRRERPGLANGVHVFRPWSEQPLSTAQLGLPSSEVAVAFAAAAALARLFPDTWLLWYAIAVGCALTRVASGAHFMSDVILGALVGYVSALILWPRHELARTQAAGSSGDARADAG